MIEEKFTKETKKADKIMVDHSENSNVSIDNSTP